MVAQRSDTRQQYYILDIISQFAPREHQTTANPRSRYMMSCPLPSTMIGSTLTTAGLSALMTREAFSSVSVAAHKVTVISYTISCRGMGRASVPMHANAPVTDKLPPLLRPGNLSASPSRA